MNNNKRLLVWLGALLTVPFALTFAIEEEGELLEPEKAFSAEAQVVDAQTVRVEWTVADGYYMYRDKFRFRSETPNVSLGEPIIPRGKVKKDEFFGDVEIYRQKVAVDVPIMRDAGAPATVRLSATSQGCADLGVCYPPLTNSFDLELPAAQMVATTDAPGPLEKLTQLGESLGVGAQDEEFLPPDQAFAFSADVADASTLHASWSIADGYYLYREKLKFQLQGNPGVQLGEATLPSGKVQEDEFIGRTEVYYHNLIASLPLIRSTPDALNLTLQVTYQGCAEAGLCYPPATKTVNLAVPAAVAAPPAASADAKTSLADQATPRVTAGDAWAAILTALLVGFGLTFTPCVLPMIPILSSIIVGQSETGGSRLRGGALSISYVLGTAVTYTAAGVLAGLTGDQLQAYFQNPWAIGVFALILVLLALSMFGFYELQMPSSIQSKLQSETQKLKSGTFASVFIMGLVSALIVGACVSPALMTVLGVAIVSKNPYLGGAIMFSMALGMGIVLIAIGFGAGFLLPKAGTWMDKVKYVFGVLLLGVAVYLLGILPQVPVLYLWAALFIITGVYMGATQALPDGANGWHYLWKGVGTLLLVWGVLALLGGFSGNRDILRPVSLAALASGGVEQPRQGAPATAAETRVGGHLDLFESVATLSQLETRMSQAKQANKPLMIDFFATWCTDCLRMEKATFSDPRIQAVMRDRFIALQVDVTDPNDQEGRAIKKRLGVFGPPALLFFSASGEARKDLNFYGFKNVDEFMSILNQI